MLHANAAAAVGELLAEQKDAEADHYLQVASALWNETRVEFPDAGQFRSGAHDTMCDWDWFRIKYPDHASQNGNRETRGLNISGTASCNIRRAEIGFKTRRGNRQSGILPNRPNCAKTDRRSTGFIWRWSTMSSIRGMRLDERTNRPSSSSTRWKHLMRSWMRSGERQDGG